MSEAQEGAPLVDSLSLEQASQRFRKALRPFQATQFNDTFKDLVIPQQAPADRRPLYPPAHPWIDNGDVALQRAVGDIPTDTMQRRMAIMLDTVSERLPTPQVIQERLDKPEAYSGIRLADFLLEYQNTNIVKLWATMSDANFDQFMNMVRRGELPSALTSDQEMKRLLDHQKGNVKPYETARGRFAELCHDENIYSHNNDGHEKGGPSGVHSEFNSKINIAETMEKLRAEFSQG